MSITTLEWNQAPPKECLKGALTIGNFDGVHRGHAALLKEARRQAHALDGPAIALTFDPHPLQILRPQQFQPMLTTVRDRAELMQSAGAEHVLLLHTTSALLHLSAQEFFHQVIRDRLAARALVEGPNFGFGRNREGSVETLRPLCREAGLGLVIVPPVLIDNKPISSSRVRDALLRGAVQEALELLDRPYRLRGTVGTGQRRGRTIGFPTANMEALETLVPGDGVYAVRVRHGGVFRPGAANIGANPTFGEKSRKLEVHILDFEGELAGQILEVDFLERLRGTRPFAGVDQLVEQLRTDVARARQVFDAYIQQG